MARPDLIEMLRRVSKVPCRLDIGEAEDGDLHLIRHALESRRHAVNGTKERLKLQMYKKRRMELGLKKSSIGTERKDGEECWVRGLESYLCLRRRRPLRKEVNNGELSLVSRKEKAGRLSRWMTSFFTIEHLMCRFEDGSFALRQIAGAKALVADQPFVSSCVLALDDVKLDIGTLGRVQSSNERNTS